MLYNILVLIFILSVYNSVFLYIIYKNNNSERFVKRKDEAINENDLTNWIDRTNDISLNNLRWFNNHQ